MADDDADAIRALKLQCDEKVDESLEATRRMLQMAEASQDAGIKTLLMLDDQGEQIGKVEQNLDSINQELKTAEEHLKGMRKCCGLCVLPWQKGEFEKRPEYKTAWEEDSHAQGVVNDQPRIAVGGVQMTHATRGYVTRITDEAREDEMDNNIQEVTQIVSNLRNMAIDMGTDMSNQNQQLERRINMKVELDRERVETANSRTKEVAKS